MCLWINNETIERHISKEMKVEHFCCGAWRVFLCDWKRKRRSLLLNFLSTEPKSSLYTEITVYRKNCQQCKQPTFVLFFFFTQQHFLWCETPKVVFNRSDTLLVSQSISAATAWVRGPCPTSHSGPLPCHTLLEFSSSSRCHTSCFWPPARAKRSRRNDTLPCYADMLHFNSLSTIVPLLPLSAE